MLNSAIIAFSLLTSIEPLPFEKLNTPIHLSEKCSSVELDEWQNIPYNKLKASISHIDSVCNYSVNNVADFLKSKNIDITNVAINVKLSLLNYTGYRSLNDRYRFYFGNKVYNNGIQLNQIGQYHYSSKRIFIDNQLFFDETSFNSQFSVVFSHEIFHAITKQNNLIKQLPEPNREYDELYALEFEKYIEQKMLEDLFK